PEATPDASEHVLAVDAALERLSARNADLGRLVELRFFGGLEVRERPGGGAWFRVTLPAA
ncbi:MAG: ECF-type sigma factor, partial [Trueperaceae bacterium]|nr:ECF-type sigma factor [Trueperaceae bacterium]